MDCGGVFDGDGDGDGKHGKEVAVAVVRHFVKKGCRKEVERLVGDLQMGDVDVDDGEEDRVGKGKRKRKVVGGWRIDKEADDKEELVLFVGPLEQDGKRQRLGAGETVLGGRDSDVMRFFDRVDVSHAVQLHVGGGLGGRTG